MASSTEILAPKEKVMAWGGLGMCDTVSASSSVVDSSSLPASSFRDLMSEDLAKDLQDRENTVCFGTRNEGAFKSHSLLDECQASDLAVDTEEDLLLAQMLQYEYDREYDLQLGREEKQFNKNSKVSLSFSKYKICPTWYGRDSDDELHDIDDTNRVIDSFEERELEDPVFPPCGYVRQGDVIVTKHDSCISGRKNAARVMDLPPGINTGDGGGFDMVLSNKVFNKLQRCAVSESKRKHRVHDKAEKATAELALDAHTRLLIFKWVNNDVLKSMNGIVSAGKEAVVFHAVGGKHEEEPIPAECAVKVFKTSLNDFKTREKYIREDNRYRDRMSRNSSKTIKLWAEKEYRNLHRMNKAGIRCPTPVLIRKHILLMSFIGEDHRAAPKLKEVKLSMDNLLMAYEEVVQAMVTMFHECNLIHADLSEYNILWHDGHCWVIDVGQAVEPCHPCALEFLFRDCTNVINYFRSCGITELLTPLMLFKKVTGIELPESEEDAMTKIKNYESYQELLNDSCNGVSDEFEVLWRDMRKGTEGEDLEGEDTDEDFEILNYVSSDKEIETSLGGKKESLLKGKNGIEKTKHKRGKKTNHT